MKPAARFSQIMLDELKVEAESIECDLLKNHRMAMICLDVEQALRHGVLLFDVLLELDTDIQAARLAPPIPENEELVRAANKVDVQAMFRGWKVCAEKLEHLAAKFEHLGYAVSGVEVFRGKLAELTWMLAPPCEAFKHEKMAELRDCAVDELRRGDVTA